MAFLSINAPVLAVVAQLVVVVFGEVYQLKEELVPANKSLKSLHAFYVFSEDESPAHGYGKPYVRLTGLKASEGNVALPTGVDLHQYGGIQLSIMRYADFWRLIDRYHFCCTPQDKIDGVCPKEDMLLVNKLPETAKVDYVETSASFAQTPEPDTWLRVKKTGVYLLVFSNCGDLTDVRVTGEIVTKNSYGYLPGNDYMKMPLYGWSCVAHVVLAVVWISMSLMRWKDLFAIQHSITAIIFLGLAEAASWHIYYKDFNSTGHRRIPLFIVAILCSVVKSVFSYMMILVAALGWGVTRPFLDRTVVMQIRAVCLVYIVVDFIREYVLSLRHNAELPTAFIIFCLLPASLLNGGIFYWVFTSLADLIDILTDRRQTDKLTLFYRFYGVLVCALVVATGSLLFQIFELSQRMNTSWEYEWLFSDCVPHVVFMLVLMAMMFLWMPHGYSQRYAYNSQIGNIEMSSEAADGFLGEPADDTDPVEEGKGGLIDVLGGKTEEF